MKTVKMTVMEFLNFRQLAERYKILFTHGYVKGGEICVVANEKDLAILGFDE